MQQAASDLQQMIMTLRDKLGMAPQMSMMLAP
jgi:hypothetical protein